MRVLYLLSTLLFSLNCSAINYSKGAANYTFVYRDQPVDYQTLNLSIQVEIPPNHLPKKSFYIIQPSVFGYAFKSFAFQDVKAKGNARTIDEKAGATFIYTDYVPFEVGLRDRKGDGYLVISQNSRKGRVLQTSLTLKCNEEVRYCFDSSQSSYFTMNMGYAFDEI